MKKEVFWNSVGTTAWSFLSLFLLIIVTRVNGIDDSGMFSFAFAFAVIMFTVGCYGGRTFQVSDLKNSFSTNDYISLRLFTSFAVLILTLLFVLTNGYDLQKSLLILLLVAHRIFDAFADVLYGIMQKNNSLHISGRSLFYKSLFSLVAFLTIDLSTKDLLLSALSLPIISLLFILLYDIPRSKKLESYAIKPKFTGIQQILMSTFLPFSIALMGLVFVNLARYFIDIYHPNLQGYFGIIVMPLSLIILLFSFISTPAIVYLSKRFIKKEFQELDRSVNKIVSIIIIATLIIGVLAYCFAAPLLQILFSIDFTEYILDIILVVLIGLAISLNSLFTTIAVIARKLRITSIVYLVSNVLLVLLCILLVDQYQIRGAIIAYVVASITQTAVMYLYYRFLTSHHKLSKKL